MRVAICAVALLLAALPPMPCRAEPPLTHGRSGEMLVAGIAITVAGVAALGVGGGEYVAGASYECLAAGDSCGPDLTQEHVGIALAIGGGMMTIAGIALTVAGAMQVPAAPRVSLTVGPRGAAIVGAF